MNKKMRDFCHCNYMEFTTVWVEANTQNCLPSSCHHCPRCGATLYANGAIGPAYDALAEENAKLHRQIAGIKQAAIKNMTLEEHERFPTICAICENKDASIAWCPVIDACFGSDLCDNWQPPEVDNADIQP